MKYLFLVCLLFTGCTNDMSADKKADIVNKIKESCVGEYTFSVTYTNGGTSMTASCKENQE